MVERAKPRSGNAGESRNLSSVFLGLLQLFAGTSEISGCLRSLRSQEQDIVVVVVERDTPQRELQRRDDSPQETYPIMGLELPAMPPAKKHIPKLDLTRDVAISTFEGLTDLAARLRGCRRTLDFLIRHEDHILFWWRPVSTRLIEAKEPESRSDSNSPCMLTEAALTPEISAIRLARSV